MSPLRRLDSSLRFPQRALVNKVCRAGYRLATLILLAVAPAMVRADEPVEAFLTALRDRGYFELAVAYLDGLSSRSSVSPEIQTTLKYEQGATLVQAALAQRQLAIKGQYLDRARAQFEQFRTEQANHPLVLSANAQLGKILIERARLLFLESQKPGRTDAERDQRVQQAQDRFQQAGEIFEKNRALLRTRLEQIPKALRADRDAEQIRERDQLRGLRGGTVPDRVDLV